MAELTSNQYVHRDPGIGRVTKLYGTKYFLGMAAVRPSTVTITNTATTTSGWTAIATGLSGVLAWMISERDGNEFDYAFTASPSTYMTSLGAPISFDTEITAIYARRRGSTNINLQLMTWTI